MKSRTLATKPELLLGHSVAYRRRLQGSFYVGDPKPTVDLTKSVLIPAADASNHIEVVGLKRADRTDALVNLAENAIRNGDCLIYLARSGELGLQERLRRLAGRHGRGDALLTISAIPSPHGSLTFNPFASGTAENIAENITQMIAVRDGRDPASLIWLDRARAMLAGILHPLVWLRDHKSEKLSAQTLLLTLSLEAMIRLSQMDDINPAGELTPLRTYLSSVPGYVHERCLEQMQTTYDHHGYNAMTAEKAMEPMVTTYRHVFEQHENLSSLDNVVQDGKILIVLFPDLPQKEWDTDGVIRLVFNEIVDAVKRRDPTKETSAMVVIDNCENILPANLGDFMSATGEADAVLVFGWQKSPLVPELKRSTSIYLDEEVPGLATAITQSARYDTLCHHFGPDLLADT
jgi:hypothetical protein